VCGLGNFNSFYQNFGILNASTMSAILRRAAKQSKKDGSQDAVTRIRGPILS
jgi:hypothetical protein